MAVTDRTANCSFGVSHVPIHALTSAECRPRLRKFPCWQSSRLDAWPCEILLALAVRRPHRERTALGPCRWVWADENSTL